MFPELSQGYDLYFGRTEAYKASWLAHHRNFSTFAGYISATTPTVSMNILLVSFLTDVQTWGRGYICTDIGLTVVQTWGRSQLH